jgi:conjugal transfer pilus assembly protein TraV
MKTLTLTLTALALCLSSGCSVLPYDNDFACKLKDNAGKCIDSFDAYDEAVTGESKGPSAEGKQAEASASDEQEASASAAKPSTDKAEYETYRARVYKQLSAMIDQPETPMVKPASTVRTLILSYSPSSDRRIAYMPRYVYSMLEDSSFVLTDYKLKRQDDQLPTFLQEQGGN